MAKLSIVKNDGKEFDFDVNEQIAMSMVRHHGAGGVFFEINGNQALSVDFADVVSVQVVPKIINGDAYIGRRQEDTTVKCPAMPITGQPLPEPLTKADIENICETPAEHNEEGSSDVTSEPPVKKLYKIECKCGAEYFCTLYSDTKSCRCRECQSRVWVDEFAPTQLGSNNETAILATNQYRVMQDGKGVSV